MRTNLLNCVKSAESVYMLVISNEGKRRAYKVAPHLAERAFDQLHVSAPKATRKIQIRFNQVSEILTWSLIIPSQGISEAEYLRLHGEPYIKDDPTLDI